MDAQTHRLYRLDGAQVMGSMLNLSDNDLERLYTKTASYWRNSASKGEETYFSVVTEETWHRPLETEDKQVFLASGQAYIAIIRAYWERFCARPSNTMTCMDFGCGVGRLAYWAAPYFEKIYGVDFSSPHLQEAKANLGASQYGERFTGLLMNHLSDLSTLPAVDVCYSFIALQHNTPPVIAKILAYLLQALKPSGLALLHIPLAMPDYNFNFEQYMNDPHAGEDMEVHILPKTDIHRIAEQYGCHILHSECIGGVEAAYSENIVFQKKSIG